MATPKQLAANRANAQKSSGPKTPEGKAKSSLNAVSHGFTAATDFLRGEKPEDFHGLHADLVAEFQPATHVEQILVEKMVHNQWLSLRAIRLQSEALTFRMKHLFGSTPPDLGLLIRYQTAADRAFHKAHAELLKAQKERKNSEIGFVSENAPEPVDVPAAHAPAAAAPAPLTPAAPILEPGIVLPCRKMTASRDTLPQAA